MTLVAQISSVVFEIIHGKALPWYLKVYFFIPLLLIFYIVSGLLFSLPPGPLCDEGMILFMEGGCDWGVSNLFFFAKTTLLVGSNVVMLRCLGKRISSKLFAPHLLTLLFLSFLAENMFRCDEYYGHPNGTLGQAVFEILGFGILGVALLHSFYAIHSYWRYGLVLIWNLVYVGVFYFWLTKVDHWTWEHSFLVSFTLMIMSLPIFIINCKNLIKSMVPKKLFPRITSS